MVQLDHQLIFEARGVITGANVHRVSTLLFQYQQTVALHNACHPKYPVYDDEFEKNLRALVASAKENAMQSSPL
jgi:hypothetical protein